MSKWELVKIEEVCEILDSIRVPVTASDRKSGIYPYYGANGIQDYVSDYIFDDELVLLAEDGGNFGSKTKPIAYRVSGKCWVNNHAHVLKAKPTIDIDYLCYSIMFYDVSKIISGTTRAKLNQAAMRKMTILLPPMETQKQIAKTLDTTAELLAMRKQQLTELDNLIKSTFYDMFGDPITNLMGWKTIVFSNCLDKIESGWSPKCEDRAAIEEEWGICKLSAVTGGYYKEIENKAIFKDTKIKTALEVKNGDLLFSRKNTIELVGSCAYVFESTKKLMIPDTVFRLCTKDNIHKLYLWGLLNCQTFKPLVQKLAGGTSGSMPNISKERLKGLKIPLPIFLKQTKFAKIVTKIEEQKALVKKAIDETQYLFDSLMSQYFE